jgi:hypothetical protein
LAAIQLINRAVEVFVKAVAYEGPRNVAVEDRPNLKIQKPTHALYRRDMIVNGRAQPSKIVGHRIRIDAAPDAYDKFDKRVEGYTKVLIKFDQQQKAASRT